jgi:hypothetical protein
VSAGGDRIGVALAAAGLNHRPDAVLRRQPHGVVEGEEAVAGQDGTPGGLPGRLQGQSGRAHPVHLARPDPQAAAVPGHQDGVGAHVAHHLPGEAQIPPFVGVGPALAHHLPGVGIGGTVVRLLGHHPPQHAAQLQGSGGSRHGTVVELQQAQVGLRRQPPAGRL